MPDTGTVALIETEKLKRFRGKPFLFLYEIALRHPWLFLSTGLSLALQTVFALAPACAMALVVDWLTKGVEAVPLLSLGAVIVLTRVLAEYCDGVFMYMDNLRRPYITKESRRMLLRYTLNNSYDFFTRSLTGKTATRVSQVGDSLSGIIWNFDFLFFTGILKIIITGGVLLSIQPSIGVIFVLWSVGYYYCAYRQTKKVRAANSHLSERQSTTSGQIIDTLTNFSTLFNLGGHQQELERADKYINREMATYVVLANREWQMISSRSNWIALLGIAFVVVAGSLSIAHHLALSQIAIIFGLWIYCADMSWLTWTIANMAWHHGRAKEQLDGLLEPYTVTEAHRPVAISSDAATIEFSQVSFTYPKSLEIFKDLNLVLKPKQHSGIVGRSGSGKSTLINLILRLYDPQQGQVLINGIDIKTASFRSLRSLIAVVPQDPTLFHRTIIENIRFVRPSATAQEVEEACRNAHAHEFISKLPKSYDTLVGERGVKLSVGQRQRVAIARALLKNAPLVILDEATSALDSESEALIQDAFHKLFEGRTVIAVAHRLSTLRQMDRIIVMENGQIIQDGPPAALQVKEGAFKKLWQLQSAGFIADQTQPPFAGETA